MYQYYGDIWLYSFFSSFAFCFVLVYNLFHLNKKKEFLGNVSKFYIDLSKKYGKGGIVSKVFSNKTLWAVIETVIVSCFQFIFTGLLNNFFGSKVGTGTNYFGLLFLTPLILFVICHLFGIDMIKQYDLITPAFPLALIPTKFACFCQGCCWGIEWEHGMYNHRTGNVEVPVQLIEMAFAAIIFIWLLFYKKKAKPGRMYPMYMIVYSATRFFSEFLSGDEEEWFGPFNMYHLLCTAGVIVGVILLVLVGKYHETISEYFRIKVSFFSKTKEKLLRKKEIVHHKKRKSN